MAVYEYFGSTRLDGEFKTHAQADISSKSVISVIFNFYWSLANHNTGICSIIYSIL